MAIRFLPPSPWAGRLQGGGMIRLAPAPVLAAVRLPFAFLTLAALAAGARMDAAVRIDNAEYEGRAQFRITTAGATWFYDKAGGGFSRIVDREGHDWISFHKDPLNDRLASAAAGYRGMPDLVPGDHYPDAGAGHPGFDHCVSERIAHDTIRTTTKSGAWAWTWRFTDTQACFTMKKADPAHRWWFLYEGPIAGRFAPRQQYWGTDLGGPRRETPDFKKNEDIFGRWRWMYFGDDSVGRILYVATRGPAPMDCFSYFGSTTAGLASRDGMIVAGFGRNPAPQLTGAGARFVVGFIEQPVPDASAHVRV
ncbi:MAG: hypothetical protein ACREFX_14960, partial [Opitutaceae bacterium]